MAIGIRQFFRLAADQVIANSAALVAVPALGFAVAANQRINLTGRIYFTVGAAGGIRFLFTNPAITDVIQATSLVNTIAAVPFTINMQLGAGPLVVFNNAVANAGNHWIDLSVSWVTSAAGTIAFTVAQDAANAAALTIQAGSFFEVTTI